VPAGESARRDDEEQRHEGGESGESNLLHVSSLGLDWTSSRLPPARSGPQ
jgi:hypothetical protein